MTEQKMKNDLIKELEEKIAELKKRWPAHSVSPVMLHELDDLEEALEAELKKRSQGESSA